MPVFVHLTSHRNLRSIRRVGIRGPLYALPVTRNFQISHQWLRELRRHGGGTIFGIYFRLPDDEPVEFGPYGGRHVAMEAAEAAGLMLALEENDPASARAADSRSKAVRQGRALPLSPEGYEAIVPRRIGRSEIIRVKPLPQATGWRYRPGAHGGPPVACLYSERGAWGLRRLERAAEAAEAAGRRPRATLFSRSDSSLRRVERLKARRLADRKQGG